MRVGLWKCHLEEDGIANCASEFNRSNVKCISVKSRLGTSDVIVQRQKDWLVTEKLEFLG